MNIFHYILLGFSVLGVIPSIRTAFKEKNKIGAIVATLVAIMWCALIVFSAYW